MKKKLLIAGIILVIISLFLFAGCKPVVEEEQEPLFNETINEEIENLTTTEVPKEPSEEFFFNWTTRNESKYEIAETDIFTLTQGNFTSDEISVFGVMLGDSEADIVERLGYSDVTFIPADESYKNMEYRKKIGITGKLSGVTFHLENDTLTRITIKPPFNKYLQGNTSIGTSKETIYILLDIPDYQDFLSYFRVFYYVEKGVEIYFKNKYVDRISFVRPREFKGVEYVTTQRIIGEGVIANTTTPSLVE